MAGRSPSSKSTRRRSPTTRCSWRCALRTRPRRACICGKAPRTRCVSCSDFADPRTRCSDSMSPDVWQRWDRRSAASPSGRGVRHRARDPSPNWPPPPLPRWCTSLPVWGSTRRRRYPISGLTGMQAVREAGVRAGQTGCGARSLGWRGHLRGPDRPRGRCPRDGGVQPRKGRSRPGTRRRRSARLREPDAAGRLRRGLRHWRQPAGQVAAGDAHRAWRPARDRR
jgi:hypothetical protein